MDEELVNDEEKAVGAKVKDVVKEVSTRGERNRWGNSQAHTAPQSATTH